MTHTIHCIPKASPSFCAAALTGEGMAQVVGLADAGPISHTVTGISTGMSAVRKCARLLGKILGTEERGILERDRTYPVVPAVPVCDACA